MQQFILSAIAITQCFSPAVSFLSGAAAGQIPTRLAASAAADTTTNTDDLLKPSYDIEPIAIRIGHGFDIHRMAPLEEAGQPVVIGGVVIPHKDQKVRLIMYCFLKLTGDYLKADISRGVCVSTIYLYWNLFCY